jgi:hypothetical protein
MEHIVTVAVNGREVGAFKIEQVDASWDRRIAEGLRASGAAVGAAVLEDEDQGQRVPAEWQIKERARRRVDSQLGTVHYRRRVYRDRAGRWRVPLDEAAGVPKYQAMTVALAQVLAYVASHCSYRRTAELVGWLIADYVSCMRVKQAVWTQGQQLAQADQQAQAAVFAQGAPAVEGTTPAEKLYCETDGVWISLQREAKASAEVRVAVMYTGKVALGKGRRALQDRVTYTGIVRTSEDWQETLLWEAYRNFRLSGTKVAILGGDGGAWVRHSLDRLELPVLYQLDRFHLYRAARRADPATVPLVQRACRLGLEAIEGELRQMIRTAADEGQREKLSDFYQYLRHNADGVVDHRIRLGLPLDRHPSLGAIEGNVDKLVVQRMKGRGMSWRLPGAEAMLALCRHREALQLRTLPQGGYQYYATPKQQVARANRRTGREETWLQASVPLLQTARAASPFGQRLRRIVAA